MLKKTRTENKYRMEIRGQLTFLKRHNNKNIYEKKGVKNHKTQDRKKKESEGNETSPGKQKQKSWQKKIEKKVMNRMEKKKKKKKKCDSRKCLTRH